MPREGRSRGKGEQDGARDFSGCVHGGTRAFAEQLFFAIHVSDRVFAALDRIGRSAGVAACFVALDLISSCVFPFPCLRCPHLVIHLCLVSSLYIPLHFPPWSLPPPRRSFPLPKASPSISPIPYAPYAPFYHLGRPGPQEQAAKINRAVWYDPCPAQGRM
jgi:hypothetical protein